MKVGRNDPCPCGSGRKYKKCCWGLSDEQINEKLKSRPRAQDMIEEFDKASKGSKIMQCLHPNHDECSEAIIKAHSIQKNKILKKISKNGLVINPLVKKFKDGFNPFQKQGCKIVSTFSGFCGYHDKTLFQPIEDKPFTATEEQIFLHIYRAFAYQYHKKLEMHKMNDVLDKRLAIKLANASGVDLAISDFDKDKRVFDNAIITKDYSCLESFVWEFDGPICFSASGFDTPTFGPDKKKITDLGNPNSTVHHLYFSVFPEEEKTYALVAWLKEDSEKLKAFRRKFSTITENEKKNFLNTLICETTDNLAVNPDSWENWDPVQKDIFENQYLFSSVFPLRSLEPVDPFADPGFDLFSLKPPADTSEEDFI